MRFSFLWIVLMAMSSSLWARTYSLPSHSDRVVGENTHYVVKKGDTLASIAQHFDIGFLALKAANPSVDPFLPKPGKYLLIPLQLILPAGKRSGIVVNLAQLRLFYYHGHQVDVFPLGIGRVGWDTPVTTTHISQKIPHPTWTPTQHIRTEYAAKGKPLPKVVPAGPQNPLGDYAMRLAYGAGDYLIHGTNKQFGVGLRVSSGCMRLFPKDIDYLFHKVSVGTSVRIIDQPLQYSLESSGKSYLEVTRPLSKDAADKKGSIHFPSDPKLVSFITGKTIDSQKVITALKNRSGYPVIITK